MSLFTKRFNELRKESGKTQAQVAADLGMKPQAVSYIAKGREPNFDDLQRIADYFDVTTDYILGRSAFRNDTDAAKTRERADGITEMMSRLRPDIRSDILSAMEGFLQVCENDNAEYTAVFLVSFSRIVQIYTHCLDETAGVISKAVSDFYFRDDVISGSKLISSLSSSEFNRLRKHLDSIPMIDYFSIIKATLSEDCSVIRSELDRLYKDIPPLIDRAIKDKLPQHIREGELLNGNCD